MIWLAGDCLVFQLANGEKIPFSSEMRSIWKTTGEPGA